MGRTLSLTETPKDKNWTTHACRSIIEKKGGGEMGRARRCRVVGEAYGEHEEVLLVRVRMQADGARDAGGDAVTPHPLRRHGFMLKE